MAPAVHISLNVRDLGRSGDFYRRFFGDPAKLKPDHAKFVTREPEIHLALGPGSCAVQDKFWLTDPDGNRWEVHTVLEDVEKMATEAAAACCSR